MMQKVVDVFAIRHGETQWNIDQRLQGQTDIPLNEVGLEQAQKLALSWSCVYPTLDAIYSSDLSRAAATAKALANHSRLNVSLCKGLRERHFGSFQGLMLEQIEAQSPEAVQRWKSKDPDFTPDLDETGGGESLNMLRTRVLKTLNTIAAQHIGQKIAVVSHGGVLDVLYRESKGLSFQTPRTWKLGNTCVSHLRWCDGNLEIVSWADMAHIAKEGVTGIEPHAEF